MPTLKELRGLGTVLVITGEREPMLNAALHQGIFFKVSELKHILRSLGLPELKAGSGKKKGVLKKDLAAQLIQHVFPSASDEERNRMIEAMTNQKVDSMKPGEEQGVTHMVSCLDAENAQEFKNLAVHAQQKVQEHVRQTGKESARREFQAAAAKQVEEARAEFAQKLEHELQESKARASSAHAAPATPAAPRHRVTPGDFKLLLPREGAVAGMSGKHDRTKKFCSVVYPCSWDAR